MSNLTEKGKELAFLLRHDKDAKNNNLIDDYGWRNIDELIDKQGFTKEEIEEIAGTDNKQRYEYNEDKTKIRARQGHSIDVEVELTEVNDCKILYHGTSDRFLKSIFEQGLLPMSRLYVHLSVDKETAEKVGKRHGGELIVIEIDAEKMLADGKKIWISNNGVYLTKKVETKYFKKVFKGKEVWKA